MNIWFQRELQTMGLVLAWIVSGGFSFAAEPAEWRTGEEIRQELEKPLGITWSAQPLRVALLNLSANVRVAIWLDRRIDPSVEPEFTFQATPLQRILEQLAQALQAEVAYVGPVVYLGPASTASKLWTLAELRQEESQRLPAAIRSAWTRRQRVHWPELSTPRELLQALADESGCQIEGLDSIPHDLWPAADLPPLTLAERLTVILAGFDRTFEIARDGRMVRLVPLPERPVLQRRYTPRGDAVRVASDLSVQFPNSNIHRTGNQLVVMGSAEDHNSIDRMLRGEPTRSTLKGPSETRYTMTVQNKPLGAVLRKLEMSAELQVSMDDAAKNKLNNLVSFMVKDATLQQVLEAATRGTGLVFRLEGRQLRFGLADQ